MKRSSVLIALVALVGIGSYAVFAQYQQPPQQYQQPPQQQYQQPSQQQYQQPMGGGMMGGGGMGGGMMGGPGMMQGGRGRGMMQGGMGRGMMGGTGRGMMMGQGAGPMAGAGCPGCGAMCGALAQESVTATSDGGVVVAVAGKLVKYDRELKKVAETDVNVDWAQLHRKMQQIMQSCPMRQGNTGNPPTSAAETPAAPEAPAPSQS